MLWIVVCILLLIIYIIALRLFHFVFDRAKQINKLPSYYIGSVHYHDACAGMKLMDEVGYEDCFIKSDDDVKLHAYLYKQKSKRFVIGIHGYHWFARNEYAPYFSFYHTLGFQMLLPDNRAHGQSEGKYIGFGVLDRMDCIAWAKYLVSTYGEDIEILLHGVSMGAACVMGASCEEELPKQVKGIIADCGFHSAYEVLKFQMKKMFHLPAFPFLNIVEKICKHRTGFDFHHHSPIESVQKANVPILFVQGCKDKMVPSWMAQTLYDACSSRKQLLMVEDAGHGESICKAKEKYEQTIQTFFKLK